MPQRFLHALAFTLTLTTNLNLMTTRDDDHHDGSKLTLPRFDPKDPTYFDNLQAYAQDRGDQLDANGGQIWGDGRQKGAFRAVASQKKICLLEHQNAFAAIQSTFIGIIFVTILLEVSPGCSEESQ